MKLYIPVLSSILFFTTPDALANSQDETMSIEQLKSKFEVRGDVFVLDPTGRRVLQTRPNWTVWKKGAAQKAHQISSQWSGSSSAGEFAIHHVWTVQDDGSIKVLIEEFARIEEVPTPSGTMDVKFVDLLKKEERILTDFSPITWISVRPDTKNRIAIRFIPNFSADRAPHKQLTELPISGNDMILTDNLGNVWTEHITFSGKYIGVKTHKGSLFLSYYPFKGATEMGVASDNRIELHLGGNRTATLTSQTAFVPHEIRATVYGVYRPDLKSANVQSTHATSTNKEEELLETLQGQKMK